MIGKGVVAGSLAAAALAAATASGCKDDPCCTVVDSFPIALARAPMGAGLPGDGALLARASAPGDRGGTFPMLVGTGTAYSALAGPVGGSLETVRDGFDVYAASGPPTDAPLRAIFRGHDLLRLPFAPIGDGTALPGGVLGGTVLIGYSVDFRFSETCADLPGATCPCAGGSARCSSMTLWHHLGADDAFLAAAGFAVIRFTPFGGGEVTAGGNPDFLGQRGPYVLPPTRVVLRSCAVPAAFDPLGPRQACCRREDAVTNATGVNLSLLVDTGVGPLVLSRSAWDRLAAASAATAPLPEPVVMAGSLHLGTWPAAIDAAWSAIPRLALVNLELGGDDDPGPCVELGRARRIEWVARQMDMNPGASTNFCVEPCDTDRREPEKAQSSAAYLELGGQIPVAVVSDAEGFLQALRFDVRPEGPEIDGLLGAGALGRSRVELDFKSSQRRALFSCEPDAPREACWAAARCPRLPERGDVHSCFGLPPHGLPATCSANGC